MKFSLIFPHRCPFLFCKGCKDRVQAINRAAPASTAYAPLSSFEPPPSRLRLFFPIIAYISPASVILRHTKLVPFSYSIVCRGVNGHPAYNETDIGGLLLITISLCMIVKNEGGCSGTAPKDHVHCGGSDCNYGYRLTDRTKEIAAAIRMRVYDFPWTDDFAAARNAVCQKAVSDYWILDGRGRCNGA